MTVTLYYANTSAVQVPPQGGPVLKLRLPTTGLFALFGKLWLDNPSTNPLAPAPKASLTTLDGETTLDQVGIPIGALSQANASLLGWVDTGVQTANEIVDIRFDRGGFALMTSSLFAMSVDAITFAGV